MHVKAIRPFDRLQSGKPEGPSPMLSRLRLPKCKPRTVCERAGRLASVLALCLCLALIACAEPGFSAEALPSPQPAAKPSAPLPSFADVARKVLPAVVNITAVHTQAFGEDEDEERDAEAPRSGQSDQSPLEEFLRRFFGPEGPFGIPGQQAAARVTSSGSGFVIDPAGYVVTEAHVIEKAAKVTVVFQDNSRYRAKIVGQDDISDLALLKIEAGRHLVAVPWGDSDAAQVGDWVLAVGNPFGLGGTVTAGIVSARGRDIRAGAAEDFLQIDAPLNRGNSGGPTFNLSGQVIGINTAIYSPSGGSVGIGFAIPSNLARPVIDQLRAHGKVERGWLGVQIQELTPGIARSFGLAKAEGALIVDVIPGGPADKAGIRQGDVIIAFNGRKVPTPRGLSSSVAEAPIGTRASVTLWRGGRTITVAAVIGELRPLKSRQQSARTRRPEITSSMGLRMGALTEELRRELDLPAPVKGVVVMDIAADSPAADSGLERGDVIMEVNHHPVATPQSAAARLGEALSAKDQNVLLLINREGEKQYLAFSSDGDFD